MILTACNYRLLSSNCPVINCNEIDDSFNVKLPDTFYGYRLYDILDISEPVARTVSFKGVKFDNNHPWVDIPYVNLSRISGQHVYKLCFMNSDAKKFKTVFFAYIIQDNNPAKPFIYMHDKYSRDDYDRYGMYLA